RPRPLPQPQSRDASPASSAALPGVHTPPRGDVLRPRRRRLASPPHAPRGADGAPRERGSRAAARPGARARPATGVAAVQAPERPAHRDPDPRLALGCVGIPARAPAARLLVAVSRL